MLTRALLELIARHEGFRSVCYQDTAGKLTIGYGFNLDAIGAERRCKAAGLNYAALRTGDTVDGAITEREAYALMTLGAQSAQDWATVVIPGFVDMPEPVRMAVTDMIYNLGGAKFMEFHDLRAALEAHDWLRAANAMQASLWYRETGIRAKDDIALMLSAVQTLEPA